MLKVAHDTLGDNAIAVTAKSCSFPKRELEEATAFCKAEGIRQVIVESEELNIEVSPITPRTAATCASMNCSRKLSQLRKKTICSM